MRHAGEDSAEGGRFATGAPPRVFRRGGERGAPSRNAPPVARNLRRLPNHPVEMSELPEKLAGHFGAVHRHPSLHFAVGDADVLEATLQAMQHFFGRFHRHDVAGAPQRHPPHVIPRDQSPVG